MSLRSQQSGLETEVRDLRLNLRAAQIREEIALAMPHLLQRRKKKARKVRRVAKRNAFSG